MGSGPREVAADFPAAPKSAGLGQQVTFEMEEAATEATSLDRIAYR
jgi:hypothetical protein